MRGCIGRLAGLLGLFAAAFCVIVVYYTVTSLRAGRGLPGLTVGVLVAVGILTALVAAGVCWSGARRGGSARTVIGMAAAVLAVAVGVLMLPAGLAVVALVSGWLGAAVLVAAFGPMSAVLWIGRRMDELRDPAEARAERGTDRPSRRTPPAPPVRSIERDPPLTDAVCAAVRRAAGPRSGPPVTTGRLLAELIRGDAALSWERVWLHTGTPESTGLAGSPDPPPAGPPADWQGVPVTDAVVRAFRVIDQLCARYRLPGDAPVAALALLAEPTNGAAVALLRGELTHARLLAVVQRDLLRTRLDGLSAVIPAARG